MLRIFFVLIVAAAFVSVAVGQAGEIDLSFRSVGYLVTNPFNDPTRASEARSVALQTDGKIIIGANDHRTTTNTNGLILRYTADGAIDTTFSGGQNGDGISSIGFPGVSTQYLNGLVVQADGKIVALATYENESDGDIGFYIIRLNTNGTRDQTFGGNGTSFRVFSAITGGGGLAQDIALQSDGKILIAAASPNFATQTFEFAVYRLNRDGTSDRTFGGGISGRSMVNIGSGNDIPTGIAVAPDGRIVLAGTADATQSGPGGVALARFSAAGVLDTSFGTGGRIVTSLGGVSELLSDVEVQADGKPIISGITCSGINCSSETGAVARFNANGSFDTTFDGDGVAKPQIPASTGNALTSLEIQPDGRIVATGNSTSTGTGSDNLVLRLNTDGSQDSTFSNDGVAVTDIGGTDQASAALALQTDGKIVTTGASSTGSRIDIAIFRYLGDSQPAANVTVSGRVTTPDGRALRNATVSLTDLAGVRRSATTSSFGFYSFDQVSISGPYTVTVTSRRFRFASRSIQVNGNLADVDFVGLE
ncbi:MAG: carboxypeptidase regulatory-like domain-containing protein [Pyrinomonadaceae bacterium]